MTRHHLSCIPPAIRTLINRTAHERALNAEASIRATLFELVQAALADGASQSDSIGLVTTRGGIESLGRSTSRNPAVPNLDNKTPFGTIQMRVILIGK